MKKFLATLMMIGAVATGFCALATLPAAVLDVGAASFGMVERASGSTATGAGGAAANWAASGAASAVAGALAASVSVGAATATDGFVAAASGTGGVTADGALSTLASATGVWLLAAVLVLSGDSSRWFDVAV